MRYWKLYGFKKEKWQFGWWFIGWDVLSLGVNIGLPRNIEIHLPFGFLILGHTDSYRSVKD